MVWLHKNSGRLALVDGGCFDCLAVPDHGLLYDNLGFPSFIIHLHSPVRGNVIWSEEVFAELGGLRIGLLGKSFLF